MNNYHVKNIKWVDIFIIFVLYVFFFSYPFFLRNLDTFVYSLIINGLLLVLVILLILDKSGVILFSLRKKNTAIFLSLFLYLAYFITLALVSFVHSSEPAIAKAFIIKFRDLFFFLILLFILNDKAFDKILKIYENLFVVLSILGLLLVWLVYSDAIHPLANVSIANYVGGKEAHRLFYGIGFTWPHTWIGSLYHLERLQSYCDEAGTFALAVSPAILLALSRRKWIHASVMFIALIFSFSIGAFIAWTIVFLVWIWKKKFGPYGIGRWSSIGIILLSSVFIWNIQENSKNVISTYISSKYSDSTQNTTSVGSRINALEAISAKVMDRPLGFGAGSTGLVLKGIKPATGWVMPLMEAGVIGWIFYCLAFGIIIYRAVSEALHSDGLNQVAALIIIFNAYFALQRGGMDSNVWQLFWLALYFRLIMGSVKTRNLYHNIWPTMHRKLLRLDSVRLF